ncbi:M20/M25/M40 family metallo-hydrolase [Sediminibacillus dalangtanensis]|uniref:M20/M25/M40 family metallo-hydrolase n=1 Tax=Sediminibacillus dalangtanensis TaxID=2729421 RepID=A0ABX7VUG5_9BACI|nr:M42 family metallopeptidase [Sediminibacillus dalangtanensis]QTN00610.1 M20/M25/M40 family metallo-hydrolase [Sediminibacillus dalangtanensis]
MDVLQHIKKLTSLLGPSGYEHQVSNYLTDYLKERTDTVTVDALGNVTARKKGSRPGPVLLLTAHMDEVGFLIKKVEPNGLLRFEKLGGNDDRNLPAQPVKLLGRDSIVDGMIGTLSAHFAKFDDVVSVRNHRELYIDIGAASEQEVLEMGVEVGTPVTWGKEWKLLGPPDKQQIRAKSLDDRSGCAVLLQVLEELEGTAFSGELIFLFTVQEEVGLRGAKTAAQHITADAALAIDTTAVSDTPEGPMDDSLGLGRGAGIKVMDASLIVHSTIKQLLIDFAQKEQIPYQLEVFTGIGTDGGAVTYANKGIPTGVLSIPSRYTHSAVELVDLGDVMAVKEIVRTFILQMDEQQSFAF